MQIDELDLIRIFHWTDPEMHWALLYRGCLFFVNSFTCETPITSKQSISTIIDAKKIPDANRNQLPRFYLETKGRFEIKNNKAEITPTNHQANQEFE